MLFNSFQFLIFFIAITGLYYILPHKYRWILLLLGSCYFYMSFIPAYILILAFTIIIDYFAGLYIEKSKGNLRKSFLICSLVVNIGVLAIFKYFNFFLTNLELISSAMGIQTNLPYWNFLLPIGLSFHTFQAMSYNIEVYYGREPAEKHLGIFALYVMFYPQLVAGPIERPQNLIHQFKIPVKFNESHIIEGLQLMAWGLFKKVVVADRLSVLVDGVYARPGAYSGLTNLVAVFFFAIQIYCDFSGYSDIAIGAAKTLGINLMKNFNFPYIARSVTEFWQRWHISLSTWFRDYLYFPLGGSKKSAWITARNILIVFLLSGLWHGANWTFIVWGALHGVWVVFERLRKLDKLKSTSVLLNGLRTILTFLFVCFSWVFFRANSISDACNIFLKIFKNLNFNRDSITECVLLLTNDNSALSHFLVCLAVIIFLFVVELKMRISSGSILKHQHQYIFYGVVTFLILFLGYFKSNSFIYFQF